MATEIRSTLFRGLVTVAVGQMAAAPALADSASGVDTMLGNALNPTTVTSPGKRDPEGLDGVFHQRTPTGQLLDWPLLPPAQRESDSGWIYSGSIEAGVLGVFDDEEAAWFRKYKDLEDGPYLNNFQFEAVKPDEAKYFEGVGGGLGYDDQYVGLRFGRYNDWRGELFYQETPHVFTSKYRSLWSNTNSDYLRLSNLNPGGGPGGDRALTRDNIITELGQTDYSELGIVRKKGGVRLDKYLTDNWRALGSYSKEERKGSRPFGAVFGGGGGGGNIEIPESIDYDTHDLWAALRYDDGVNNLNLGVTASLFRNNHDIMTFENPLSVNMQTGVPASTFATGRYDLYPDNDYWEPRIIRVSELFRHGSS